MGRTARSATCLPWVKTAVAIGTQTPEDPVRQRVVARVITRGWAAMEQLPTGDGHRLILNPTWPVVAEVQEAMVKMVARSPIVLGTVVPVVRLRSPVRQSRTAAVAAARRTEHSLAFRLHALIVVRWHRD